jgi:tRNA A-37 threonylcarbamoyl transferase component Bud32/tetratricopeptide (TPR) repeat protein
MGARNMADELELLRASLADRYAIECEIGRGGMATVYRASDLKHRRRVAIKVLKRDLAAGLGPERFLREVEVTAALRHPHILPLLDSGLAEGLPYYVMPLVEGESLRARLKRERQLPIEDAVTIAREVSDALSHAHGQGVVHRDIKPENILLEDGHAVVTDFGVARAVAEAGSERLTLTGMVVGTPGYLSPEQAMGEGEDGRSDIYALGCVLYEMLAGQPPITGSTAAAILARTVTATPPGVRQLRDTVPVELERIVTRALALVPADRQRTAAELATELAAVPVGAASGASGPMGGLRGKPRDPRRTGRLLVGLGALAVVTVTALAVWRTVGPDGPVDTGAASRVVVVPYENRTGDPARDPVGQMVADWITEGLAQTGEVSVVPSSVVLEALGMVRQGDGGRDGLLRGVTGLTQSGIVVTGWYYLLGDELELHSEVLEVPSGTPITTVRPVRGPSSDPGAAIEEVRVLVLGALGTRLSRLIGWEPPLSRPPTFQAFQAYARGMEEWVQGDFVSSAEWLERAYALDTTHLRSLLLAAAAHRSLGAHASTDSLLGLLHSRRDELTPYDRARVDFMMAGSRGDLAGALAAARAGLKLAPVGTLRFGLIWTLVATNRPEEARRSMEEIRPGFLALQPTYYDVFVTYADILHLLGEHSLELEVARDGRDRLPSDLRVLASEGRARAALGHLREIRDLAGEIALLPSQPGFTPGGVLETLAQELRVHGQSTASVELGDLALAWHSEQPEEFQRSPAGRTLAGRLLYLKEEWTDAARVFESLAADSAGMVEALGYLGAVAARQGESQEAARISRELAVLQRPYLKGSHTLRRARIAALLGERDEAVQLLRRAFSEGLSFGTWVHIDMDLEPLRGYPSYEELVKPKG